MMFDVEEQKVGGVGAQFIWTAVNPPPPVIVQRADLAMLGVSRAEADQHDSGRLVQIRKVVEMAGSIPRSTGISCRKQNQKRSVRNCQQFSGLCQ